MRPRAIAATAALVLPAGLAGCGGDEKPSSTGALQWSKAPQVFRPRGLPRDRVVIGQVRNRSSQTLHLTAARLRVVDRGGRRLQSSAGFTNSYAHGLFGAFQQPSTVPRRELLRLGRIVELPPGAKAPFFAAWHLAAGAREPVRVDYGAGALLVPRRSRSTAR